MERAIGIYLSNGPINPCDFIRYLLIYGACLYPAVQIAGDVARLYKIYRCHVETRQYQSGAADV